MQYVKLIAKPNTWYKVGTEVFYDDSSIQNPNVPIKRLTKEEFEKRSNEWDSGLMVGLHTPDADYEIKLFGTDDRIDGELCSLDEFDVIETNEYLEFQNSEELEKYLLSVEDVIQRDKKYRESIKNHFDESLKNETTTQNLLNLKEGEMFIPKEVICDETNNTVEDSKNGVINVDIFGVKITPVDNIEIKFTIPKDESKQ